jgi:hypothetical protein
MQTMNNLISDAINGYLDEVLDKLDTAITREERKIILRKFHDEVKEDTEEITIFDIRVNGLPEKED